MASKICFISPSSEYTALYNKTLVSLNDPPMIFEGASKATVTAALEAQQRGCDVVVTSEFSAKNLWGKLNMPVVPIPVSAHEIALTLHRAKAEYGEPVAFLEFREHNVYLSTLREVLSFEFRNFIFREVEDCRPQLYRIKREGFSSVVGGAIPTLLAREMGFPCVPLLPSPEDILKAFHQAEQIVSVRQAEQREAMKFRYVVDYSFSGIIFADEDNGVTVFNSAAERIFGMPANQVLGEPLEKLFPQNRLLAIDRKEQPQLEELKAIGQKQLMVNRIPIVEEGKILGTVFTFHEVSTIQSMEEKIRRASHTKGLTAKLNFSDIEGNSKAIRETVSRARRFASTDETILITGESGTGKEVFAQSIHNSSSRRSQPFVAINCSAIPAGLLESELFGYAEGAFTGARRGGKQGMFELAHRGTIFLDEIGELSREAQGDMLRVLQEKEVMRVGDGKVTPVDVRVISATNNPLERAVQQGRFRWDLYHRLNVLQLRLPPLRGHPEDVLLLAGSFVSQWCTNQQLAGRIKEALLKYESLLTRYPWPGNVRELQNLIRRAVALVQTMTGDSVEQEIKELLSDSFETDLPIMPHIKLHKKGKLKTTLIDLETELIRQQHDELQGNKTELARSLGIGRTTLWRKLNPRSPGQR